MSAFNPRVARWLAFLTKALVSVCLLANLFGWFIPEAAETIARNITTLITEPISLTTRALVLGGLISTVQLGILTIGFWAMAAVFKLFAQGDYLHPDIGKQVQCFGKSLALFGVLSPLMRTLLALVITLDNPEGQQILMIRLVTNDFVIILVGMLLIMLGYALKQAAMIAEENRQIV
ncbi:hypothetical protein [uncultured Thiothrix sp.]|uniref:hypothetical protein n=1 Tax=uncultured Thiothrix sp. TaxID=223185 RepID=UPI002629DDE7|nr:hypothetical protein [uncultured Thiothrix sp.]HMT91487.1 hypothetical protein [Thiolinea sp.]